MLTVPLINIADWDRRAAAKASLEGARADESNTQIVIEKNVLRDYYTLLGNEAVLLAATRNLEVAQHNLTLARDRKESGTGSELDVQRAVADQAKAEQSMTARAARRDEHPPRPLLDDRARARSRPPSSRRTTCTKRPPSPRGWAT